MQKIIKKIFDFLIRKLPYFLILVGLFQSFRETFSKYYVTSDIAAFSLAIEGVEKHGWSFLKDYAFPAPYWLFTLLVPDRIIFQLFGDTPYVMMTTGVVTFWLSAVIVGCLVAYFTSYRNALWSAAFVLCAPQSALIWGGWLTYPAAHNLSMLWGLVGLYLYILWLDKRHIVFLFVGSILLCLASYSDVWLIATVVLPIFCAAAFCFIYTSKNSGIKAAINMWGGVLVASIIVAFLAKTKFLGYMEIGSSALSNIVHIEFSFKSLLYACLSLSFYFNIIPFFNPMNIASYLRSKDIYRICYSMVFCFVNLGILTYFVLKIIASIRGKITSHVSTSSFLRIVLILSILSIITMAFVFGSIHHIINSFDSDSRYLANILYVFSLLLFLFRPNTKLGMKFRLIVLSLFFVTSILSNIDIWNFKETHVRYPDMTLANALEKEGILQAYGPYWGTEANSITWLTHGHVTIRPLRYSYDYNGFLPTFLSSPSWYHIAKGDKWALLLTNTEEGAACDPYPSCEEAAIYQFGPPIAEKHLDRTTVFIFRNMSEEAIFPVSINTWKEPLKISKTPSSSWRSFYPNYELNKDDIHFSKGWDQEIVHASIRTKSDVATIDVPVTHSLGTKDITMRLVIAAFGFDKKEVDVLYEGAVVAQWRVGRQFTAALVKFPAKRDEKIIHFELHLKDSKKPSDGIKLKEVQVLEDP